MCKKFGGQENDGVVIRLYAETDDELQVIIQDNLTSLTDMHAVAIGHVVVINLANQQERLF